MSNRKSIKKEPGPFSTQPRVIIDTQSIKKPVNEEPDFNLGDKLTKLGSSLEKSFKPEFIDSILYLIKLEHQDQSKFDLNLNESIDFAKLEYFMQQLKKISKTKTHLFMLNSKMLIHSNHSNHSTHTSQRASKQATSSTKPLEAEDFIDLNNQPNRDFLILISDFKNQNDHFLLTNILVRFLCKLLKFKLNRNDFLSPNESQTKQIYNLSLILLSCLADLCYYEEIRIQVCCKPYTFVKYNRLFYTVFLR